MLNVSCQGLHGHSWLQAATELEASGETYVLVTVLGTSGSTPRGSGTKMVVSQNNIYATIGGGHLEFKVIEQARCLIEQGKACQAIENFQLGASLGQCCGGNAVVMLEVFSCDNLPLDIYGAGHVAQALIPMLAQLPIKIRWIDSRADIFPAQLPANVQQIIDHEPVAQVSSAAANSAFLILTHNHQLDFELCQAIIKRDDALWLGVIGSNTKNKKFQHRLAHRGFSPAQIQKMICPVGLSQVTGKLPMEVAVSIAGQLIELYQGTQAHKQQQQQQKRQGLQWQTLKNTLTRLTESEFEHSKKSYD
ncbi:MAG: xanthine dehydrogenase accessory factor [Psychromonas sp.]|jgi:xanthine dehydrogenase accessory factor